MRVFAPLASDFTKLLPDTATRGVGVVFIDKFRRCLKLVDLVILLNYNIKAITIKCDIPPFAF